MLSLTQGQSGLAKELNAIEEYINLLDDVDKVIMQSRYFDCVEMEVVAANVYMTSRAVYYRISSIVRDMSNTIKLSA